MRHERIRRRHHDRREKPAREPREHHPACRRKPEPGVASHAGGDANESRATFTESRHDETHHNRLTRRHYNPDRRERGSYHRFRAAEPELRVERPSARHHLVSERPEEEGEKKSEHDRMLLHLSESAKRVGAPPLERPPSFKRQRLRQHKEPVGEIGQAQRRSREEWRARPERAEQSSDRRPDDEANSKSGADHSEILRSFFGRTDVRDISIRRSE